MRLIDADALIDALGGWDWQELYLPVHFKDFIIDEAPTIDAVPVVRCKDCKYWKVETEQCDLFDADDYCSYGERKAEP